jgi:predicted ATP-dependent protease
VYINVVGRIRLDRGEGNAADLAIAVALASSRNGIAVRSDTAFVGEVGLLGELRTVPAMEKRIQEARRMGFSRVVTPRDATRSKSARKHFANQQTFTSTVHGLEWIQCETLQSAINEGLVRPIPKRAPRSRTNKSEYEAVPGKLEELGLEELMDDDDCDDESNAFL